jgi:AAA+ ATPase superfamily predicted ATPase
VATGAGRPGKSQRMTTRDPKSFQSIPNPYIVGNPIEDRRMFFGREDDFAYIAKKITAGETGGMVVLCGTRRSGKTSILFQIKGGRLGEGFLPVLIDMQSMTVQNDAEFLSRLTQELLAALNCPELAQEERFRASPDKNPFTIFQSLVKELDDRLQGRKLVLMFDEYELFETHIEKGRLSTDILNLLANWMESRQRVFVIFTGSDQLESRNPFYWNAFLGKALHRRISFLSRRDTLRLVTEPLHGTVFYRTGVPEAIYELTAGQPFYTQVLCQTIIDYLNEKRQYDVADAEIQEAIEEIIHNPLPQMIFTWGSLSDMEKISLSIIAEKNKEVVAPCSADDIRSFVTREKTGYRLHRSKLNETLERLFHQDILKKEAEEARYSFRMDLWRQWMARMHTIWQVLDEITSEEREIGDGIVKESSYRRRLVMWVALVAAIALGGGSILLNGLRQSGGLTGPANGLSVAPPDSSFLNVDTNPAGAIVFLDELRLGATPLEGKRVQAGPGALRIELAGYKDVGDSLTLVKDDTLARSYALQQRCGRLRVTSVPQSAAITLDGRATGKVTPATLENLAVNERHEISLSLPGFRDKIWANLEVREDVTDSIHHDFARVTHPLTVLSAPSGASASLDGQALGETPRSLPEVTEGKHQLVVSLDKYQTERLDIDIPAPGNVINVGLRRLPQGTVIFKIKPYAELWIDGELKREIVQHDGYNLDQGVYRCELRNPYYEPFIQEVRVVSGDTVTVTYDFDNPGGTP